MILTRGAIFRYLFMPQLVPRFRELFTSGFSHLSYFIALVYGALRLLSAHHPYLNPANVGRYGVANVLAEAANNLQFSWRNIDQIILYLTILAGMIMTVLQFVLFAGALFVQPVLAGSFADYFVNVASVPPDHDLAYMAMDMVFGVPDIFNSCVSNTEVACIDAEGREIDAAVAGVSWGMDPSDFPMAIHIGLHNIFRIYSMGLLFVAIMLFSYFIVTILAETMQSGTPFGRRYNHVWAPVRMVFAFGLLVPVGHGLNTSQYFVLYAAKFGSAFATNGWVLFNETLSAEYGDDVQNLLSSEEPSTDGTIATPNIPEVGALLQFMYAAKTCQYGERRINSDQPVGMYAVTDPTRAPNNAYEFDAVDGTDDDGYAELMAFLAGSRVAKIRFGHRDAERNGDYAGFVKPSCGEVVVNLTDSRSDIDEQEVGARVMQTLYINMLRDIWFKPDDEIFHQNFVIKHANIEGHDPNAVVAEVDQAAEKIDLYSGYIKSAFEGGGDGTGGLVTVPDGGAVQAIMDSDRFNVTDELVQKGWAGAAIWYNRVAEMNGFASTALLNIPVPSRYPAIMEEVYSYKLKGKGDVNYTDRFDPQYGAEGIDFRRDDYIELATAYWYAYSSWQKSDVQESPHAQASGNAIFDILNALLGTDGLFNMRENINVHPLAQLSGVGRSLIEASMRNLSGIAATAGGGILAKSVGKFFGEMLNTFGSVLVTFTMITLVAGFVLFYIVPFLPFIYFSFSFGGWIKGIFEAMVGAPLWALAHIRIDGQGLSGQAALSGYFLIFEIFLRPILMIAGLLGSIATFSALVYVLNVIFDLVVANVGGFDVSGDIEAGGINIASMRNVVDEFFYTVIYVVVVYLMGMASFKMIDLVPNNILRWMGQSITTFNDSQENAAESLAGRATQGAQQFSQSVGGGMGDFFKK